MKQAFEIEEICDQRANIGIQDLSALFIRQFRDLLTFSQGFLKSLFVPDLSEDRHRWHDPNVNASADCE
jgi:hypothetical protein